MGFIRASSKSDPPESSEAALDLHKAVFNEWINKWGKKTNKIHFLYQENWNCWMLWVRGTTTASFVPNLNRFKTEMYSLVFTFLFTMHSSHLSPYAVRECNLTYGFILPPGPEKVEAASEIAWQGLFWAGCLHSSSTSLQASFQTMPIKPHSK